MRGSGVGERPAVGDRYRDLRLLGRGSCGAVWAARDRLYDCEVALKALPEPSPEGRSELVAEFRRASELSHPNLVTLYDLVVDRADAFFTMELVHGRALRIGDPVDLADLAVQLLAGLEALHDAGLVHRDLKPANLLLEPGGRAVIVDFGLAVLASDRKVAGPVGTWTYLAPELVAGYPATPAADLYALGVLLAELGSKTAHTGELPFGRLSSALLEPLSGPLRALVEACTATEPSERPSTADARRSLGRVTAHRPVRSELFVGREAELARIRAAVDARVPVLRVVGPSGIGKSSLVWQALGAEAAGRCHPRETTPYNAFQTLSAGETGSGAGGVQALAHELAARCGRALVVDDAQWMDDDSRRVLSAWLDLPGAPPVILCHRPIPQEHPLARTAWFVGAEVLTLGPLAVEAARDLAARICDPGDPTLAELSGGHPLLLRRLARRWTTRRGGQHTLPELIAGELAEHGPEAEALAARVAVHGRPLPLSVLAASGDLQLQPALARLVKTGLLTWSTTIAVALAHDSTRDVVLAGLSVESRVAHHRALAAAFAETSDGAPAEVARHLLAAGSGLSVREPALRAAEVAEAAHAWSRAAECWGVAFDAEPATAEPAWLRRWARALASAGRAGEAGRLLRDRGGPEDLAQAAEWLVGAGELATSEPLLRAAAAAASLPLPSSAWTALPVGLWWSWRTSRSDLRLAPSRDPNEARTADLGFTIAGALGQYDSLRTFAVEGRHLEASLRSGDPERAARGLALHVLYLEGRTGPSARVAELDALIDDWSAGASPELLAWIEVSRGYRSVQCGRMIDALARFDRAEATYGGNDAWRWERGLAWTHRLVALSWLGRHRELTAAYGSLAERLGALGDRATSATMELCAGWSAALCADRPDEAARRLDRGAALLPQGRSLNHHFLGLMGRVATATYAGRLDEAWALARAPDRSSRMAAAFRMPRAWLRWARAGTGAAVGAVDRAAVRRAADSLAGDPTTWSAVASAQLRAIAARGEGGERAALVEAARMAERSSYLDLHDAAEVRLAELDGDPNGRARALERAAARGARDPERLLAPMLRSAWRLGSRAPG